MATNVASPPPAEERHPDSAIASLLSLSMAAASAMPVSINNPGPHAAGSTTYPNPSSNLNGPPYSSTSPMSPSVGGVPGYKQHRRLSSTGKARRRLSDARDAASRPSPASLSNSATAALSLASLSLSTSPSVAAGSHLPQSLNGAAALQAHPSSSTQTAIGDANAISISSATDNDGPVNFSTSPGAGEDSSSAGGQASMSASIPIPIANGKYKKRGVDHKCESCSKIYRHPSCLIKHRWEHTPHWREASKFVLSKHQQVQLLEAAAILSHLSPKTGTSLPEDRSLWPSFLSGGTLPPPEGATFSASSSSANGNSHANATNDNGSTPSSYSTYPVSSSVPAQSNFGRASSTGPRLHDYTIPVSTNSQVRPGLVGVPNTSSASLDNAPTATSTATQPVPVPIYAGSGVSHHDPFGSYRNPTSAISESWGAHSYSSSFSYGTPGAYSYQSSGGYYGAPSAERTSSRSDGHSSNGVNGVGSGKGTSRSRSGSASGGSPSMSLSASASGEEGESIDVDIEGDEDDEEAHGQRGRSISYDREGAYSDYRYGISIGGRGRSGRGVMRRWKREETDDDFGGFSVREEDEFEMDEDEIMSSTQKVGTGRTKAKKSSVKAQEWDGMEMEMDMD